MCQAMLYYVQFKPKLKILFKASVDWNSSLLQYHWLKFSKSLLLKMLRDHLSSNNFPSNYIFPAMSYVLYSLGCSIWIMHKNKVPSSSKVFKHSDSYKPFLVSNPKVEQNLALVLNEYFTYIILPSLQLVLIHLYAFHYVISSFCTNGLINIICSHVLFSFQSQTQIISSVHVVLPSNRNEWPLSPASWKLFTALLLLLPTFLFIHCIVLYNSV